MVWVVCGPKSPRNQREETSKEYEISRDLEIGEPKDRWKNICVNKTSLSRRYFLQVCRHWTRDDGTIKTTLFMSGVSTSS
jgi:hypothetical protein